ncbi:MAG: phage tail protein [Desulfobacterales bacterium]|nr:phage tail protein [Desulfobacterales bacterium]
MAEPFIGEIRMFGFKYAPRGWALCDGQLLPIDQNQTLYSLLDTHFGGDGRADFALPDLRGRTPVHPGDSVSLGEPGGAENVTLTGKELPAHTHEFKGSSTEADKVGASSARELATLPDPGDPIYGNPASLTAMNGDIISHVGEGEGHDNIQPILVINFSIALEGLFPSRD